MGPVSEKNKWTESTSVLIKSQEKGLRGFVKVTAHSGCREINFLLSKNVPCVLLTHIFQVPNPILWSHRVSYGAKKTESSRERLLDEMERHVACVSIPAHVCHGIGLPSCDISVALYVFRYLPQDELHA